MFLFLPRMLIIEPSLNHAFLKSTK